MRTTLSIYIFSQCLIILNQISSCPVTFHLFANSMNMNITFQPNLCVDCHMGRSEARVSRNFSSQLVIGQFLRARFYADSNDVWTCGLLYDRDDLIVCPPFRYPYVYVNVHIDLNPSRYILIWKHFSAQIGHLFALSSIHNAFLTNHLTLRRYA